MERAHTSDVIDDKLFETDQETYFPTQFVNGGRSFTMESAKKDIPFYDSKIYNFYCGNPK
jgi:hypothetical protein